MAKLTVGTYRAKAIEWSEIEAKDKGTFGFHILFEIVEGDCKGERIAWESFFSDKTTERMYDSLSYCGWDGKSIKEAKGLDTHIVPIAIEEEEGQPVPKKDANGLVVGMEPAKKYLRVRWINDPDRGGTIHKIPEPAAQEAFEQRMQGSLEAWRSKRNKPAPAAGDGANFDFGANVPPTADGQVVPPAEPPKVQPSEEAKAPNPATGY